MGSQRSSSIDSVSPVRWDGCRYVCPWLVVCWEDVAGALYVWSDIGPGRWGVRDKPVLVDKRLDATAGSSWPDWVAKGEWTREQGNAGVRKLPRRRWEPECEPVCSLLRAGWWCLKSQMQSIAPVEFPKAAEGCRKGGDSFPDRLRSGAGAVEKILSRSRGTLVLPALPWCVGGAL